MAKQTIKEDLDEAELRRFVRAVLEDVHALERMLSEGLIESGVRRIGAEQEMFLVDRAFRPANAALRMLDRLQAPQFTTELALFNLEANLSPLEFRGNALSRMEAELRLYMKQVREAAEAEGLGVVLCGILPTLEKSNLGLESMTPIPRYHQLNRRMVALRGGRFSTKIKGLDELDVRHDNVMLEACNTSFQLHFQVGPDEFASLYNLAQVVTAPVLAAAVNSPVLLRHRLWHETRVALFQQSLDVRSETKALRGTRQRVSFGDHWVERSIMEIYREDVARFRALIAIAAEESAQAVLDRGGIPQLRSLRLHNGTVYRWNRPCYGIHEGRAHLRIENRVLPAGPSVLDEIANAAFFYGLMCGFGDAHGDVTEVMSFDDAKGNFVAAARYGLQARFRWVKGRSTTAEDLILGELLPLAREGLVQREIDSRDIDRYLGVIEERVRRNRTGAQWALDSLAAMEGRGRPAERYHALTASMAAQQAKDAPVHEWGLARIEALGDDRERFRTVGQVMSTDLFTVHPEDVVDLVANLMQWEHIQYVAVEDQEGQLVGLVSSRTMLRELAPNLGRDSRPRAVNEIMKTDLVTVGPETTTLDAVALMRRRKVGCLPVVVDGRLVGILTEHDLIDVTTVLLDRWLCGP